ncbi:M1 family metallopeptidase [Cytophagaceae bacterium DM2B3-1]|uniref:M1 family metallopeptidase n=1 Tax=Xanthocytophaga flava TaxID=3048013 RepID=A0ABT7CL38_9BACT|nr:M1 family metallopeptidase [Xanthocytophaga flavus]MDJ1493389.1 M1 family metallopeptidase [Xanthocytophaga flavus]
MKKSFFTLLTVLQSVMFTGQGIAQQVEDLYVPLEFQSAYAKGTRSTDGKPGPNYWQNKSEYAIQVELVPATREIKGSETITYFNNSNDTLSQVVIRLYPNLFKKGAARGEDIDPGDVTDGITISSLQVDNRSVETKPGLSRGAQVRYSTTNMFVRLSQPLYPKTSLKLAINWTYTIPAKTHIREGTYGDNTFMVAYWYPQVAVYDDIDGWDRLEYRGQTEFYNDFSTFDVTVKVPQNFVVWGTGVWQNPEESLTQTYLTRYLNSKKSDEITHIITAEDLQKKSITQNKAQLQYHFKAENVPDFVFAASNRYLWDATSAIAEPNRRTAISAVYDPASKDFYEIAKFSKQSVEYLSTKMPGVPYPYPNLTIFNGSGGMEFPMFVNDASYPMEEAAEVVAHEIAHTYFPFYMGINERKYAWMDEGWAQFLPNGIPFQIGTNTFYPQQYNALYLSSVNGREMEMPMMMPSTILENQLSYGFASYFRPAVAYATLQDILGKDKFKQVLNEYMSRWNGKHPSPYDFFYTFNNATKEDLTWFWKPWFFERGYSDLNIKKVETGKTTKIIIGRNGILPVPISLTVTFTDGTTDTHHETARVWQSGVREFAITKKYTKSIQKIDLGSPEIPDINIQNNTYSVTQ